MDKDSVDLSTSNLWQRVIFPCLAMRPDPSAVHNKPYTFPLKSKAPKPLNSKNPIPAPETLNPISPPKPPLLLIAGFAWPGLAMQRPLMSALPLAISRSDAGYSCHCRPLIYNPYPRGSICGTIMELGPQRPSLSGF